jgi:UvrD/REP helicase N-terminal domain
VDESAAGGTALLVIAGAGTGKTKTLAHRVAHLIKNGADPARILLLTFSRRAAVEMIKRVKRITVGALGIANIDLPWAGTFHAVGARILREHAQQIGLKTSFTIDPIPLISSICCDTTSVYQRSKRGSRKKARAWRFIRLLAIRERRLSRCWQSIFLGAPSGSRTCESFSGNT